MAPQRSSASQQLVNCRAVAVLTPLEILAEATKLTAEDREDLIVKLRALQQLGPRPKIPIGQHSPLYEALRQEFSALGHSWPPYNLFLERSPHAKSFVEAEAAMWAWLEPMFPKGSNSINKNSIAAWFADLAVPHMQGFRNLWAGVLITVREAPHIIDQDFPGYARNGWLPFLINARLKGGNHVRDESGPQAGVGKRPVIASAGGVSHNSR
jgi:hypothetical protein